MGARKIVIKKLVANSIAKISWFIESKGMINTAEKYADDIYNFLERLADHKKSYPDCRDKKRALLGYKCVVFRKKYTIVFVETETELIIHEILASKLIYW